MSLAPSLRQNNSLAPSLFCRLPFFLLLLTALTPIQQNLLHDTKMSEALDREQATPQAGNDDSIVSNDNSRKRQRVDEDEDDSDGKPGKMLSSLDADYPFSVRRFGNGYLIRN